jgi:hypothetical protein
LRQIDVADELHARVEVEIPRLRGFADAIRRQIETEYRRT